MMLNNGLIMGGMGGGEEVNEEAPTRHYMHIQIAYRRDATRRSR